jgi:hypothetical protein
MSLKLSFLFYVTICASSDRPTYLLYLSLFLYHKDYESTAWALNLPC